jgi:hypothetical protein
VPPLSQASIIDAERKEAMILEKIIQIVLAAIITERLLDGLHRFYWTAKIKRYLVGEDDGRGILPEGALREFIRCKFCQSWWMAWGVSLAMLLIWEGWSLHWLWMGLVAGGLANKLHDVGETIKAMKYLPFKGA